MQWAESGREKSSLVGFWGIWNLVNDMIILIERSIVLTLRVWDSTTVPCFSIQVGRHALVQILILSSLHGSNVMSTFSNVGCGLIVYNTGICKLKDRTEWCNVATVSPAVLYLCFDEFISSHEEIVLRRCFQDASMQEQHI